jgi:hypothetical protein
MLIISAPIAPEPAPLNALVWIFGIAGAAALGLALTTMAFSAGHKRRRDRGKYRPYLSALAEHLRGIKDKEDWLKESTAKSTKPTEHRPPPADSTQALTTGDLVRDPTALRSVVEIATELRRLRK